MAEKLRIAPKFLWIAALPILVFCLSEVILAQAGNPELVFDPALVVQNADVLEASGRYTFLAAALLFVAVAVLIVVVFLHDLLHLMQPRMTQRIVLTLAAMFAVAVFVIVIGPDLGISRAAHGFMGTAFLTNALGAQFGKLQVYLDIVNLFTASAAAAAVMGTILCLSEPDPHQTAARPDARSNLEAEINVALTLQDQTKRYLYLSGLMLSGGMFVLVAWMRWPQEMIADEAARTAYQSLVTSHSLFYGASYSVLILSYFLPVTLVLSRRVETLRTHGLAAGIEEPDESFLNPVELFKIIFALVSPLLAGVLGSVGQAGI